MEYFVALVMLVIMTAVIVNFRHKKSDKEYDEYLAELEQVKERKKERLGL